MALRGLGAWVTSSYAQEPGWGSGTCGTSVGDGSRPYQATHSHSSPLMLILRSQGAGISQVTQVWDRS